MPITKSAAKRMRQNIKHRRRNLELKQAVRSEIKALQAAIAESDKKAMSERLSAAQSKIDKAANAGVIHKNKAARQKSQLVKDVKTGTARTARPKASAKPAKTAPKTKPAAAANPAETPEQTEPAQPA